MCSPQREDKHGELLLAIQVYFFVISIVLNILIIFGTCVPFVVFFCYFEYLDYVRLLPLFLLCWLP